MRRSSLSISTHWMIQHPCKVSNRILTLALMAGMLVIQLPLPVMGQNISNQHKSPVSLANGIDLNCVIVPRDACCSKTSPREMLPQGQEKRYPPTDNPCCPDGCDHCSLPCCAGIPLAKLYSRIVIAQRGENFSAHPLTTFFPLVEPDNIFRPPRS